MIEVPRRRKTLSDGSLAHLRKLLKKLSNINERPRFSGEDKRVISVIINQEILRRKNQAKEARELAKLGIDIKELEEILGVVGKNEDGL